LNVVGIVCALASEARHLDPGLRRHAPLASLADGTLLVVSGIGAAAARSGAHALMAAGAGALATFGLAGGLDPELAAGAILLPHEVVALDGTAVATAGSWRERVAAGITACGPVARGSLLSSGRAIGSIADKAALHLATGAVAVDMESLAVAQAAAARQLPFIAVRVIVDTAADAVPRAAMAAADGAGHVRLGRLIAALLRAPAELAPLIRLGRCYRAASRSLALVARSGCLGRGAYAAGVDARVA
jgi:adenosylhomocysteine nucleosidase